MKNSNVGRNLALPPSSPSSTSAQASRSSDPTPTSAPSASSSSTRTSRSSNESAGTTRTVTSSGHLPSGRGQSNQRSQQSTSSNRSAVAHSSNASSSSSSAQLTGSFASLSISPTGAATTTNTSALNTSSSSLGNAAQPSALRSGQGSRFPASAVTIVYIDRDASLNSRTHAEVPGTTFTASNVATPPTQSALPRVSSPDFSIARIRTESQQVPPLTEPVVPAEPAPANTVIAPAYLSKENAKILLREIKAQKNQLKNPKKVSHPSSVSLAEVVDGLKYFIKREVHVTGKSKPPALYGDEKEQLSRLKMLIGRAKERASQEGYETQINSIGTLIDSYANHLNNPTLRELNSAFVNGTSITKTSEGYYKKTTY
jgi:hypothetical protein